MKRFLCFGLLLTTGFLLKAQTDKEKVWQLIVKLDHLLVLKDSAQLNPLILDDFIGTIPSGEYFGKLAYISYHCRPNLGLISLTGQNQDSASIRIFGNTAIVNRRVHAQLRLPNGSTPDFDVQRMEVCVKQNGNWFIASGQGTQVNLALRPH
jgi:hypothetical protein